MLPITSNTAKAQRQSTISLDSRIGYSTNTYLNPFFGEWDPSVESGFALASVLGQMSWFENSNSYSLTGGFVFEPIFDQVTDNWKGGLGLFSYSRTLSNDFNVGIESGLSHFSSSFQRTQFWIQPKVSWRFSPFSMVHLRVGSSFRNFENFADSVDSNQRFDLYSLEFETWPGYRWQVNAGLYGQLETLPSLGNGFTTSVNTTYYFDNSATLRFRAGLEQYRFDTVTETDGPGGPPIGFPPGGNTEIVTTTDRILRFEIEGSYPLNQQFSVFAGAEALNLNSEVSQANNGDFRFSAGIRFNFRPTFRKGDNTVNPEWDNSGNEHEITIRYSGEGRLYLVGSFNNWTKPGIPLREESENRYSARLDLTRGAYEYKILKIQGNTEDWIEFSNEAYTVDDGFGGENAVVLIESN